MNRRGSLVVVTVSAACFATLAVLTALAYDRGASPLQLLAWRFAFASLLLVAVLLVRNPSALKIPLADVWRFAALSLVGYGAASLCFFFALTYADASIVAVLLYTYPAIVAAAGWVFFGDRLSAARIVGVVLAFAGCVLVVDPFGSGGGAALPGVLLGLGAAVGYASFNLLSHRWLAGRSRLVMMAYTFGITSLAVSAIAVATGTPLSAREWGADVWLLVAAIVLVPTFAAILLYLEGIRGLGPSQASLVSTFEPIFTIFLAAIFLHERMVPVQWAGTALVLAAVIIAERASARPDELAVV